MRFLLSARWLMLALVIVLVFAASLAGAQTPPAQAGPGNSGHGHTMACPSGQARDSGGNCVYPACPVAGTSRNGIGQCTCSGGMPPIQGHCGGKTPTTGTGTGTSPHLGSGNSTGGQTTLPAPGSSTGVQSLATGSTSHTQTNMIVTGLKTPGGGGPKTPGGSGTPNTPTSCGPGVANCAIPIGSSPGSGNRGPEPCTGGKVRDGGGNCVYPACPVAGTSRNVMGQCTCSGGMPPIQGHCGGKTPTSGTGTGTSPHLGSGNSTGGQTIMPVTGRGNGTQSTMSVGSTGTTTGSTGSTSHTQTNMSVTGANNPGGSTSTSNSATSSSGNIGPN
jgi:hypothetical protein